MKDKAVILVVDDQVQNIELLEAYLGPQGYSIIRAESGEEALTKLVDNGIDLILLDVMMPGMDGFEVIRKIRQSNDTLLLPIILVTALKDSEQKVKGIEAGCDDFISKPVDKIELLARVKSLLKVKAYNDLMSNYREELKSEVAKSNAVMQKTLQGSIKILVDTLSLVNPEAYNSSIEAKKMTRILCERLKLEGAWEYEIAAMLSHSGLSTMPPEIINKYRKNMPFNSKEKLLFKTHPAIARKLIVNIPKLEAVAEAIGFQMMDYPDTLKIGNKRIVSIARMLKLTIDYETTKRTRFGNVSNALGDFQKKKNKYDPEMFEALETELGNSGKDFTILEISARNIALGMLLADDIIDIDNKTLILPKGTEITELFLTRLMNFLKLGRKISNIKILSHVKN